jgi:hypothetical protein
MSKDIGDKAIKPSEKVFFLNSELIRVIHINRSSNIVKLLNLNNGKYQSMLYSDFKKHRKRAYSVISSAKILNRSRIGLQKYYLGGLIPKPIGAKLNGERDFRVMSYYSEDTLFEIREIMTTIHHGRPRKDGNITPSNVPTEQELRSRMGDAIMLYTKTSDGRFIPTWKEDTW